MRACVRECKLQTHLITGLTAKTYPFTLLSATPHALILRARPTAPVTSLLSPPPLHTQVGMLLLVFVIAGGFMLAAPLLLPAALAFFAAAWLFWRQAFLGVHVRQ